MGSKRKAWRIISKLIRKSQGGNEANYKKFRIDLEVEIKVQCKRILDVVNDHILADNKGKFEPELLLILHKIKMDYYRYLAELGDADSDRAKKEFNDAYLEAKKVINDNRLPMTHPQLLGLGLNNAVYLAEIGKDIRAARDEA